MGAEEGFADKRAELLILHVSSLLQQQCDAPSLSFGGFHVRFGPDEKDELRSALFPKAPAVLDVPLLEIV